ncbi:MAG: ribonuclease III, partial [Planctomycetes bacterium]|nr:ribonuclease III [Planctomycetota bacterium]
PREGGQPPASAGSPSGYSPSEIERLTGCEDAIHYKFWDRRLLREALTHSSAKDESHPSNERMEFLGDSVLGLIVCEHLYRTRPAAQEGPLTEIKSAVVSRAALGKRAKEMELERWLIVGKGTGRGGRIPASLHANLFEALICAVYLDAGFEVARLFVLRHLSGVIPAVAESREGVNYKSLLQQWAQRELGVTPGYRVISESGPEHHKTFEVRSMLGAEEGSMGNGRSKKEAEQEAARLTLEERQASMSGSRPGA